ncbi:hypothetical protein J3F83DRAFT_35701 [Trichoderma novae-zelandiae]
MVRLQKAHGESEAEGGVSLETHLHPPGEEQWRQYEFSGEGRCYLLASYFLLAASTINVASVTPGTLPVFFFLPPSSLLHTRSVPSVTFIPDGLVTRKHTVSARMQGSKDLQDSARSCCALGRL